MADDLTLEIPDLADRLEAWATYTTTTVEFHRGELNHDLRAAATELRAQDRRIAAAQLQLDRWARVMPIEMRLRATRLAADDAAAEGRTRE